VEPSRGANGARARWAVTPIDGRSGGGIVLWGRGVVCGIGVEGVVVGRGGSVVGDRRRGGLWGHGFGGDQAGIGELWWDYM
jgi:hypothetical protein